MDLRERPEPLTNENDGLRTKKNDYDKRYQMKQIVSLTRTNLNALLMLTCSFEVIARLQRVHLVVDEISAKAKAIARDSEPSAKLGEFTPYFDQLLMEYSGEYEKYRLHEIVVASVAPTASFYYLISPVPKANSTCVVASCNG